MKRLVLSLMLVLAASLATAQNTVRIIATTDIRSFSSADAPVIGSVPKGTVVGVVSRDGDWIRGFVASQNPDGSMVWHLPKRPRLKRRPY